MVKRYSRVFKDWAVRMLVDCLAGDGLCSQWRAVNEIAVKLGIANESLRRWYEQHLVVTGERQGFTREEHEEVKRLKRENAQLRRANEILKTVDFQHLLFGQHSQYGSNNQTKNSGTTACY